MRRGAWLCVAALALLAGRPGRAPLAAPELIFRVPEVMVRHAAASKPVGTGSGNGTRNDTEPWGGSGGELLEVRYEEYFVEHDVSTTAARKAARELDLDAVPATRPGCGVCSQKEMEYCETRVLADHCCCERRFLPEPFPWLPHSCYVGPRRCKPLARDCVQYTRLRDCCCYKKIAERWKGILSRGGRLGAGWGGASLLLLSMLLLVAHL